MLYRIPETDIAARAARITHLFLDCDGVLTDGSILVMPDGDEIKRFDVHDGHGIVLWRRAGYKVGIISGRGSTSLECRAGQLGVEFLVQKTWSKLDSFRHLVEEHGLLTEEIAFMGDDVVDIPIMHRVGLAAAPRGAVAEAIEAAHVVTARPGGHGAVRELIEMLLRAQDRWRYLLEQYEASINEE